MLIYLFYNTKNNLREFDRCGNIRIPFYIILVNWWRFKMLVNRYLFTVARMVMIYLIIIKAYGILYKRVSGVGIFPCGQKEVNYVTRYRNYFIGQGCISK